MNCRPPTKRQRRDNPITPLDHESVACVATPQGPISTPVVSTLRKEIILSRLEKEIVQGFLLNLSVPRKYPHHPCRTQIPPPPTSSSSSSSVPKKKRSKTKTTATQPATHDLEPDQHKAQKSPKSVARQVLDSRLCIGINQCTRALERYTMHQSRTTGNDESDTTPPPPPAVSLVIVCRDTHPPTIQAHIPYLVRQQQQQQQCHPSQPPPPPAPHNDDQSDPVLLVLPGKSSLELAHVLKIKKCSMICFTKRTLESKADIIGAKANNTDTDGDTVALLDKYHAKIDSFIDFCKDQRNDLQG